MVTMGCNSSKATAQTEAPVPQNRSATQQGPRQGGPDLTAMIEQLKLTDEQAVTFKAIKDRYATKARELRQAAGDDREAMRTKMEGLRASENKEINGLLNADQQKAYAKIMAEQEASRPQRGAGQGRPGGGGGRPGGGNQ